MKLKTILAAAAAAIIALGVAVTANAQGATGTVTVIHGVPGLTVDVYVNGDLTLEGFEPGTITDPLELPEGDYMIDIYGAGADPATEDPAITGSAALPAGANASIIAHLAEDGTPQLSVFVNDTSAIEAGNARLVVRHTAAAPAVDVLADGDVLLTNLANPNEAQADVPAGTYSAAVAATGTTDPVLGPTDLTLETGASHIAYAVGSLQDGTLDLLVQTIAGLGASAAAEPTVEAALPSAGLSLTDQGSSSASVWLAIGLGAVGLLLLGGAAAAVRARR